MFRFLCDDKGLQFYRSGRPSAANSPRKRKEDASVPTDLQLDPRQSSRHGRIRRGRSNVSLNDCEGIKSVDC